MRVVVFGATGKIGKEVVKMSLAHGDELTAFVRDPGKMNIENNNLTIVTGDIFDVSSVAKATEGQDAVICALGTNDLGKNTVRSQGTENIVNAMNEYQVKRLIVVTAMGIAESWKTLSVVNRTFFATVLRNTRKDHELQEVIVKDSDLDWTIFRPGGLNSSPATESYLIGENIKAKTSQIPCADVAHAITKELYENNFLHKAITITN